MLAPANLTGGNPLVEQSVFAAMPAQRADALALERAGHPLRVFTADSYGFGEVEAAIADLSRIPVFGGAAHRRFFTADYSRRMLEAPDMSARGAPSGTPPT